MQLKIIGAIFNAKPNGFNRLHTEAPRINKELPKIIEMLKQSGCKCADSTASDALSTIGDSLTLASGKVKTLVSEAASTPILSDSTINEFKNIDLHEMLNELSAEGMSKKDLKKLSKLLTNMQNNTTLEKKYFTITKIDSNKYRYEFNGESRKVNKTKPIPNRVRERNYARLTDEEKIEYIKYNSRNTDLAGSIETLYRVGDIDRNGLNVIYDAVQHKKTMSFEELEEIGDALNLYKQKTYYKAMNKYLRGEPIDDLIPEGMQKGQFVKKIKEACDKLKYFITASTYNHEMELYRRCSYSTLDNVIIINKKGEPESLSAILQDMKSRGDTDTEWINQQICGMEIKQKGFLSTSLNENGANSCDRKEKYPILLRGKTKDSYSGIYIDAYTPNWNTECEFLMRENTNMKLKHIKDNNGSWDIETIIHQ